MSVADRIEQGLFQLGLSMSPAAVQRAADYLTLLARWNQVTNLTAVEEPDEMVGTHLMDSLSIAHLVTGRRVIDIGSGAGLPGIPLALLYPDKDFILLDSNGKKTRFMTQAVIELDLGNVSVVQARAEDYEGEFDHVVVRALAELDKIAGIANHLIAEEGSVLAMKGAELEELTAGGMRIKDIIRLEVPFVDAERQVVVLGR